MKNKAELFTSIPHTLMGRKDLTDADKLTLGIIISFIENDKEFFMGNDRLGDMMGISKNAASKRILRLQSLGCVELSYTYKPNTKEVDKRYVKLISIIPQVSPDKQEGIASQATGCSVKGETVCPDKLHEVSPKVGGIIQPSLLDNLQDTLQDTLPNKETPAVESKYEMVRMKGYLCSQLNITTTQFEKIIVEGNLTQYHNQELLNKYQEEIKRYW